MNTIDPKSKFVPLKQQHLWEKVYRQLRNAIAQGDYRAGDRLSAETELASAFGVGRSVIRQALAEMAGTGLITVRRGPGGGAFVQNTEPSTTHLVTKFIPLKQKRLSEEVYLQLKEAILVGDYKPGDGLPPEKEIAEIFGVGRSVIREALRFLENIGLIVVRRGAGGGAFVRKIESTVLTNTFEGIVKLAGVSIEELAEARSALEMGALPLIMERMSDEDIKNLEQNVYDARQSAAKGIRQRYNMAFHIELMKATRNELLIKISEAYCNLMAQLVQYHDYSPERALKSCEEHEELIAALKGKNAEKISRLFLDHTSHTTTSFRMQRRAKSVDHLSGK